MDYLPYYWLEDYLFSTVCPRFHRDESLSAFDFFLIVIWKSNRAKSKIATGLLDGTHTDLDKAVRNLTKQVHDAPGGPEVWLPPRGITYSPLQCMWRLARRK